MAIVGSGNPITFGETGSDDIRSELGEESAALGLAEYYGATVDLPSIGAALSFSDFYGVEELKIAVAYGQTDPTQELEAAVAEIPPQSQPDVGLTIGNSSEYDFSQIGYEQDTATFYPVYNDGNETFYANGFTTAAALCERNFPVTNVQDVPITTRNYTVFGYSSTGVFINLVNPIKYSLSRRYLLHTYCKANFGCYAHVNNYGNEPSDNLTHYGTGSAKWLNGTTINYSNQSQFIYEEYSNGTDLIYLYIPSQDDVNNLGSDVYDRYFMKPTSSGETFTNQEGYDNKSPKITNFDGFKRGEANTLKYMNADLPLYQSEGSFPEFYTYTDIHYLWLGEGAFLTRAGYYGNWVYLPINLVEPKYWGAGGDTFSEIKNEISHTFNVYTYNPVTISPPDLPAVSATPAYTYDNARKSKYRKNDYDNLDTYATTASWPLSQSYSADWKPTGSAAISQYFMEKMQINNGLYQVRSRETFDAGNVSGVDLTTLPGRNTPVQLNFTIATGKAAEFGYTQFFRLYRANAANANTLIDYFVSPQNPADKPTIASSSVAANETTVDFTLGNLDATQTYRLRWQAYQDCVVDVTNVDAVASGFSEEFLGNAIPATIRLSGGDSTDYSDLRQGVDLMLEVKISTNPITFATVRCHEFFRKGTTKIADTTCDFLDGFLTSESII
jgi:hypothetical protein